MKFQPGRIVNRMHIPITRVCNRQCPSCGIRDTLTWFNKGLDQRDVPVEELRKMGSLLGPLDTIEISGGEPTLHADFEHISNNLRTIFNSKSFMLVTNGVIATKPEKMALLLNYDWVYVSHYTQTFVERYGVNRNNDAEVAAIRAFLADKPQTKLWVQGWIGHVPNPVGQKWNFKTEEVRCAQWKSPMMSCYEGMIYGCCVAYGLPNRGVGVPLTRDWRDHIHKTETPCETSFCSQGLATNLIAYMG